MDVKDVKKLRPGDKVLVNDKQFTVVAYEDGTKKAMPDLGDKFSFVQITLTDSQGKKFMLQIANQVAELWDLAKQGSDDSWIEVQSFSKVK